MSDTYLDRNTIKNILAAMDEFGVDDVMLRQFSGIDPAIEIGLDPYGTPNYDERPYFDYVIVHPDGRMMIEDDETGKLVEHKRNGLAQLANETEDK